MLKGNKGEWSELYALCYLLYWGRLYAADRNLNMTTKYYPILRIFREETSGVVLEYRPSMNSLMEEYRKIRIYMGDCLLASIEKDEMKEVISSMLREIPAGEKSFVIPEIDDFFNSMLIHKVKADSTHKQDITIQIEDVRSGVSPVCGFSIKSYLGSNPTLVNAVNFTYLVENCNHDIMDRVNNISSHRKIIDRINLLHEEHCIIKNSSHPVSTQFEENLEFIDSMMPEILAQLLEISYTQGIRKVSEAVYALSKKNPLGYSNNKIYEYKVKKFLAACALGMTPERVWEGVEDANGGYIVVKQDGSVLCYHLYDRSEFEQYLFDYTVFEKASTSRHGFMNIFEENGQFKIKLNLQVRFV